MNIFYFLVKLYFSEVFSLINMPTVGKISQYLTNCVFHGDLHTFLLLVGHGRHLDGGVDDAGDALV